MQYVGKPPRHRDRNDMLVKQRFLFFFLAMQVCSFADLLLTAALAADIINRQNQRVYFMATRNTTKFNSCIVSCRI